MARTAIMIHGAFCGGWAFDRFREPFEAQGWRVLTPDLPGRSGGAGMVSTRDMAADIARLAAEQDEPPVLIGHSMGGLVAQMAAQRGPCAGLALLAPSSPWGVHGASVQEAISAVALYALGPYWMGTVSPDLSIARAYSLDRLDATEAKAIGQRMTAESGLAMFETLNWWLDPMMSTQVGALSVPAFVASGGRDQINPPATVAASARRLNSEYREFSEMSHWLIGEPGWENVAGACLDWLGAREA